MVAEFIANFKYEHIYYGVQFIEFSQFFEHFEEIEDKIDLTVIINRVYLDFY